MFLRPRFLLICAQSCKNKERGHNKNDVGWTQLNSLTPPLLLHNQTVKEQVISFTLNNTWFMQMLRISLSNSFLTSNKFPFLCRKFFSCLFELFHFFRLRIDLALHCVCFNNICHAIFCLLRILSSQSRLVGSSFLLQNLVNIVLQSLLSFLLIR